MLPIRVKLIGLEDPNCQIDAVRTWDCGVMCLTVKSQLEALTEFVVSAAFRTCLPTVLPKDDDPKQ